MRSTPASEIVASPMTPEDLDPPFARPIDALERLPQRLAMLYECGRHAAFVGKHRSEAQWQHRAVVGNALQEAMMIEDHALDPIGIVPDLLERGAGLRRQVADESCERGARQRPYGTPAHPADGGRTGEVVPFAQVDNPVGVDARFGMRSSAFGGEPTDAVLRVL